MWCRFVVSAQDALFASEPSGLFVREWPLLQGLHTDAIHQVKRAETPRGPEWFLRDVRGHVI